MARYGLRLSKISRLFKYMHKNLPDKKIWLLIYIKQDNLIDLIRMKNSSVFFACAWNHKLAGAVCCFVDTRLRRYRYFAVAQHCTHETVLWKVNALNLFPSLVQSDPLRSITRKSHIRFCRYFFSRPLALFKCVYVFVIILLNLLQ